MFRTHKGVLKLKTENGKGFEDLCVTLPVVNINADSISKRRRREIKSEDGFDNRQVYFNFNFDDQSHTDNR